ncbi:MAG: hypothetical protein WCJ30_07455, partial [Deltaproteobacteria bacterium]
MRPTSREAHALRSSARAGLALTLAFAVSMPRVAGAQSPGANATRRALIDQAGAAREAGDHARAIDLAQRAAEIRMSVSLRMFLAEEQSAVGQITAAMDNAETCTREVRTEPNVTDRGGVGARCRALLEAATRRVAHVVVRVPGSAQGVQVHVAGDAIPTALWNVPYVVNPGSAVVEASGPGGMTFNRSLQIGEGETQTVDVVLVAAVSASSPPPARASAAPATVRASGGGPNAPGSPIGSYVVMGVGGATLIASVALWVLRAQALEGCAWDASNVGYCDTPAQAQRAQTEGRTLNVAAPVTLGIGAALAIGGAAWFFF